jgi:hypothetical protein
MIAAKVVTHRSFLLFSIAGGVDDEPTFTQGPAKNKIMAIDSIGYVNNIHIGKVSGSEEGGINMQDRSIPSTTTS